VDVRIVRNAADVAAEGAARVAEVLSRLDDAVLGLATGETPRAMYRELVAAHERGELSFAGATSFNLDEYLGLDPGSPQSYRSYMQRELFDHVDIDAANTFLPVCADGQHPDEVGPAYEAEIRRRGGIDLQILGIGRNGHIGFNEPASSLGSRTRVKTLTRETLASNRHHFGPGETQPELAITMGVATILDAYEILLLATGESKADAVRAAIEGPVAAMCPASALQHHRRVTVLLDDAAASKLELRDYFCWVDEQNRRLESEGVEWNRRRGTSFDGR